MLRKVRRVVEVVLRVDEGLADRILVGPGDDRRHLGDEPDRRHLALPGVVDVGRIVVEGRHRARDAADDRHRVRVAPEAAEEIGHLVVKHGVLRDPALEVLDLRGRRQLAVEQQVADLEEVRLLGELLDRVAAIEQLALVAVDEGDRRRAGAGRGVAGIEGEDAGVAVEAADVDHVGTGRATVDRQVQRLVADGQLGRAVVLRRHWVPPFERRGPRGGLIRGCRRTRRRCDARARAGGPARVSRGPRRGSPPDGPGSRRGRVSPSCRTRWARSSARSMPP
jgi:hypothetical protein